MNKYESVKGIAEKLQIDASDLVEPFVQGMATEAGLLIVLGVVIILIGLVAMRSTMASSACMSDKVGSTVFFCVTVLIGGALIANNVSEYINPESEAIKEIIKLHLNN